MHKIDLARHGPCDDWGMNKQKPNDVDIVLLTVFLGYGAAAIVAIVLFFVFGPYEFLCGLGAWAVYRLINQHLSNQAEIIRTLKEKDRRI